jgi:hypothetical protein
MRSSRTASRALSVLALSIVGVVLVAGISPGAMTPLTKQKAKKLFYTKAKADARFLDVGELRGTVEGWHQVGASGQPGFGTAPDCSPGNCWQNLVSSFNTVGFYKDPYGVVHLKGAAQCIAPGNCGVPESVIFTLPEGYRPPAREAQLGVFSFIDPGFAQLQVTSTGEVTAGLNVPETLGWVSLDGITFRAA